MGCPRDGTPVTATDAASVRSATPPAASSPAASTVSQPRKRMRAPAQPRRSSMQTRAKGRAPNSSTSFRVVLQSSAIDESQLGEWQGELPNLHSKNKTHDQRQHDAESEQQQSISRPQGVEREEFLETHLQHALGGPGSHSAASYIPIPSATTISDEQYLAMYPRKLEDKKKSKAIRTRRRHSEFKATARLYSTYFMDEVDLVWLNDNNRAYRESSAQPAASTSSSITACDPDDPMDVDDGASVIRIKTEPLPDRSSVLRSPAVSTPYKRSLQDSDKRVQTEPLPDRLLTPNGMGPPSFLEHQHLQDGSNLSEDAFEFIMHHLEWCALGQLRGDHAPTIETLRGVMEPEFPQRVCAFVHESTSARSRLSQIPCICTPLTVVYPHWLQRRQSREGRSLFPQLLVPKDITQDGEDPYLVFRDTNETWKRDQVTTNDARSRNPRRDAARQKRLREEEERRRNMPKRVKLTVTAPPPPPPAPLPPTPAPPTPTPAPSASNTAVTPASNNAFTPAPNPPTPPPNTAVHTPHTPSHTPPPPVRAPANGTAMPRLVPVPVVEDGIGRLFKDQSQTPVDVCSPPLKVAAFFSVADARSAAETVFLHHEPEPMDVEPMEAPMSPLTEPPTYEPGDPDA